MPADTLAAKSPDSATPNAAAGSSASKDKTSLVIASERELVIERTFNGPQHLVFAAWTDAELVKRWWAPKSHGVTIASCTAEIRVGGRYRYVLRTPDGNEIAFSGTYSEITPSSRLVYDQVFEPMAHLGAAIITIEFHARGDQTHLVSRETYPSKEVLDGVIASGMESGMRETMNQLDALVEELARG